MSNKEISLLAVDIDSLHRRQYETLKRHIIDTLKEAVKNVSEENFKKAEQMTFNSPAGDEMGCDNNCIDFGFNGKEMDFLEAIDDLKTLKEYIKRDIDDE